MHRPEVVQTDASYIAVWRTCGAGKWGDLARGGVNVSGELPTAETSVEMEIYTLDEVRWGVSRVIWWRLSCTLVLYMRYSGVGACHYLSWRRYRIQPGVPS